MKTEPTLMNMNATKSIYRSSLPLKFFLANTYPAMLALINEISITAKLKNTLFIV